MVSLFISSVRSHCEWKTPMEPWHIIVALIQGLVEWLPISSEGQVVLFVYNLGAVPQTEIVTLVVWLHLGTALAVLVRYPRTILEVATLKDRALFRLLVIATFATAVTAIPLYLFLRAILTSDMGASDIGELLNISIGILLMITALVLYLPTRSTLNELDVEERDPTNLVALTTGLVQGVSVLPGLSRSGLTVSALLMQKIDKEKALRFSFLMSVPAVLGILVVEILIGPAIPSIETVDLLAMEVIVFITGLASMEFLLRIAKRIQFWKLCLLIGVIAVVFGIPVLL